MTSQTRKSFSSPGGPRETYNDQNDESNSTYAGLNYAQHAALMWANAAVSAPSPAPTPTTASSHEANSISNDSKCIGMPSLNPTTHQNDSERNSNVLSLDHSFNAMTAARSDPSASIMSNLLSDSFESRLKNLAFGAPGLGQADYSSFHHSPQQSLQSNRKIPSRQYNDPQDSTHVPPEAAWIAQFMQSRSTLPTVYENQWKQQQQQAAYLIAAALAKDSGMPNLLPGYLDQMNSLDKLANSMNRTDSLVSAFNANNATNIPYAQALIMAMAAACGNANNPPAPSGIPTMNPLTFNPTGANYDLFSTGNSGSGQGHSSSTSGTEPTESFNEVLNFLNHCLNASKGTVETNAIQTPTSESKVGTKSISPTQRRSTRGASNCRSRVPNEHSATNPTPSFRDHAMQSAPTRHRGRGRPPKSTTISIPHIPTSNQNCQLGSLFSQSIDEEDADRHVSTEVSLGESTASVIENTIDDVLRRLAACDYDPAVVATRYASTPLGMALNRKKRKGYMSSDLQESGNTFSSTSLIESKGAEKDQNDNQLAQGSKRSRTVPSIASGLRLPLALGWRRETLVKGIGPAGILGEVTYISPCGRRLWNLENVREFLKLNNVTMLSVDDFSFKSYVRLGDYYECSRAGHTSHGRNYIKLSDVALDSLISSSVGSTEFAGATRTSATNAALSNYWDVKTDLQCNDPDVIGSKSSNQMSTSLHNQPPTLPPAAHSQPTSSQKSTFHLPHSAFDLSNPVTQPGHHANVNVHVESSTDPPAAHAMNNYQSNQVISTTSLIDSAHSIQRSNPFVAATAPVHSPWSSLQGSMNMLGSNPLFTGACSLTGMEPSLECEFMKHFFIQLADEHLRLDREKKEARRKAFLEEREKHITTSVKERLEFELTQPVEDTRLLCSKPLPKLEPIAGNRLSSHTFGQCLSVIEFLHAFTEILCIDPETIPTLGMFQAGLLDRDPQCQQAILHLLIELLKFAILDPGLPSSRLVTQLIGQRFSELEVNSETVTGLLRVFLIGRNGYEDEMSDWLLDSRHFIELTGEQQAALLAFVCDEMVCSSRLISSEIDRTIDLQAALKREKWVLESKLRRLRFLANRKNTSGQAGEPCMSETRFSRFGSEHSEQTGAMEECSMSPGCRTDDVNESIFFKRASTTPVKLPITTENSETPNTPQKGITVSMSQNPSSIAPSGTAASIVLSGDEDDNEELGHLEIKIEKLHNTLAQNQRAIDECTYRLSGLFLGQDRYYRRYYALGHMGGIYVDGSPELRKRTDQETDEVDVNDLSFGFDPDHLVSEIQKRRRLAERRRYKIIIPSGPANSHNHTQRINSENTLNVDKHDQNKHFNAEEQSDIVCNEDEVCKQDSEFGMNTAGQDNPLQLRTEVNEEHMRVTIASNVCTDDSNNDEGITSTLTNRKSSILDETASTIVTSSDALVCEKSEEADFLSCISRQHHTEFETAVSQEEILPSGPNNVRVHSNSTNEILEKIGSSSVPTSENECLSTTEEAELQSKSQMTVSEDKIEANSEQSIKFVEQIDFDSSCENHKDILQNNSEPIETTSKQTPVSEITCKEDNYLSVNSKQELKEDSPNLHGETTQPLDLSTKAACLPVVDGKQHQIKYAAPNEQELLNCWGFDDVLLTTASLLFMTHTSMIPASVACTESLSEPWKSVIEHYKSILIRALVEEASCTVSSKHTIEENSEKIADSISEDQPNSHPLRDSVQVLREFFHRNPPDHDTLGNDIDHDHQTDPNMDLQIEEMVNQELRKRNIQLPAHDQADTLYSTASNWCSITEMEQLEEFCGYLLPRGIRESSLFKFIERSAEFVQDALPTARRILSGLADRNQAGEHEARFLRVRSRRGKGRGNNASNTYQQLNRSESCVQAVDSELPETAEMTPSGSGESILPGNFLEAPDLTDDKVSLISESSCADLNPAFVLEHRLRRRTNQHQASKSQNGASIYERLEKRPGVAAFKLQAAQPNGRCARELIGCDDPVFVEECSFLEEVEGLEDRVLNASLQMKGWQAPVKVLDDESIHLIPHAIQKRSRFEHWPLDLARIRLLGLESHLERRYLLPPLNTEIHLDVVAESNFSGEQGRLLADMTDHDTESESGLGGGPGSESTSASIRDGDFNYNSQHQPLIRRVISRQPSEHELCPMSVSNPGCTETTQDAINCWSGDQNHDQIPPGLLEWRQRLRQVNELDAMRVCMDELISAIAWEKSIMKVLCQICRRDNNEAQLLLCDGCDHGYHTYCFRPPLTNIPQGDWFCHDCVAKATGRSICYVCGQQKLQSNSTQTNTNGTGSEQSQRLLTCEVCSRSLHGPCAKPPMPRIPRRWFCANCIGWSTKSRKTNNPTESGNPSIRIAKKTVSDLDTESCSTESANKHVKRKATTESTHSPDDLLVAPSPKISKSKLNSSMDASMKFTIKTEPVRFENMNKRMKDQMLIKRRGRKPGSSKNMPFSHKLHNHKTDQCNSKRNASRKPGVSITPSEVESPQSSFGSSTSETEEENKPRSSSSVLPQYLEDWIRKATDDLIKHESSWAFRKPVNSKQVPFYRKVIKRPMDLSTIQRKASHPCAYGTFEQWLQDVRLIFNNCEIFNEDESEVGKAGHAMRAYFEAKWACPPKLHQFIEPKEDNRNLTHQENLSSDSEQSTSASEKTEPVNPTFDLSQMSGKSNLDSSSVEVELKPNVEITAVSPISPAQSTDSESRSSGFSGFEQNEYMLGLQLNDIHSPTNFPTETERTTGSLTSMPSTMPSEACLPTTSHPI